MNTNSKHTTPYSASDIDKYRKGELSAREMYDLEQAALDDPFLADAIDGIMQHSNGENLQDDLIDLHARLNKKVSDNARRGRIIHIRRRVTLAAALILLLGIGYTFFKNSPTPAPENSTAPAPENSTAPAASATQAPVESKAAADSTQIALAQPGTDHPQYLPSSQPNAVARAADHSASRPAAKPTSPAPIASSRAALSSNLTDSSSSPASLTSNPTALTSNPTALPSSPAALNKYLNAHKSAPRPLNGGAAPRPFNGGAATPPSADYTTTPSLVFTGKVLDFQNHPLSGAFLALNGNAGYGTTTDDQGYFKIFMHPFDSTKQLTVSMIGYDHTTYAVNALSTVNANDNVIRLRPSSANLDEVVVSGYGRNRKETEVAAPSDDSGEKLDTSWTGAAPVIGRQAYLQYLTVAKKKLGLDPAITGTEIVSFLVARNGALSDFKIEQSLSPAHDAGILRLVTDGPSWQVIRGRKVRAAVTVNF